MGTIAKPVSSFRRATGSEHDTQDEGKIFEFLTRQLWLSKLAATARGGTCGDVSRYQCFFVVHLLIDAQTGVRLHTPGTAISALPAPLRPGWTTQDRVRHAYYLMLGDP